MRVNLGAATDFVWRNARLIDRRVFGTRFLGAPPDAVVPALRGYQNDDGGFGHGLDPDIRAPDSQPVHVDMALRLLYDGGAQAPEVLARACSYLLAAAKPTGGVPAIFESVDGYPRAAHWEPEFWTAESLNPTASIAGLLHAMGFAHVWRDQADAFCWQRLTSVSVGDGPTAVAAFTFLNHAPDRRRAEVLADLVATQLPELPFFTVQPGVAGFALTPLHLAPAPDLLACRYFDDDLLGAHLDALEAGQQDDGGWPLTWEPPGPGATVEWRGRATVEALVTLQRWRRLQGGDT